MERRLNQSYNNLSNTEGELFMAEKIYKFDMDDSLFLEWRSSAPHEDIKLHDRLYELSEYFSDMLFEEGSPTGELLKCQSKLKDGSLLDDTIDIPDELKCFSYTYFKTKVEPIKNNCAGYFNLNEQLLCVSREYLKDDSILLHEMIHLHEHVLNVLPLFYHDTMIWTLYIDLEKKIKDLDEIISGHAHILSQQKLYSEGGLHDILFLLKSLDLDIKMGYSLGTVCGYEAKELLKNYTYSIEL